MTPLPENRSVRELSTLRPSLRGDLRFSVQEQGGTRVCVIEDPATSRFHRVGLEEYCFLRALDGSSTVATLLARIATATGGETLLESEALQVIQWARANHLLAAEGARGEASKTQTAQALSAVSSWINPLSIKLPLGRPDQFFQRAADLLKPLLGTAGLAIWLIIIGLGIAHLAPEWTRFQQETSAIFSSDNWLWLTLGWLVLKVIHECGHGVLCRHFGAPVREVGVMFILGMPLGYVDATASLALPSRRQRIAVASAGVGAEFLVAAIAAIIWSCTKSGTLHTIAHDVILTGTLVTLLFNANPLMRFDGYFILADLFDVPNLAPRGRQWMSRAIRWIFLGGKALRPEQPKSREEWIVASYGIAASLWQITVSAGLLIAASTLLKGGGLLFAVIASALTVAKPLIGAAGNLRKQIKSGAGWGMFAMRTGAIVGVIAAILFVPWRPNVAEPAVIELADTEVLRAECAGFVASVYVQDGAVVAEGDLLVELQNDEVAAQLRRTRLELEQQELKARLAYTRQDVGTFQAESAHADSLRRSVEEQANYAATLQVRAPFAGRVTNRRLAALNGHFVKPGEEILRMGRVGGQEVKIAVSARHEPQFREALGSPLLVRVAGRNLAATAMLTQIDAHASRQLAWPALTAMAGGPVALRKAEEARGGDSQPPYELAEPYFTATAKLQDDFGLMPGETGQVRFRSGLHSTLWQQWVDGLGRWIAKKQGRA